MASKLNSMTGDDEEFNSGFLLRDIEEISKALYLNMNPPAAFNASSDSIRTVPTEIGTFASKPGVIFRDSPQKDKKSSIWKWKPLKALSHMRSHRFNCYFFLHVHAIEGLPLNFKNLNLSVTWKRKNEILRTRPVPIYDQMAEFEETLTHRCTIHANTNGTQNLVDYEPKLFLLRTFVIGAPSVDIGRHWIDLTRLLPLSLDDLEGDQRRSGKWTTSFKLTGRAEGAMLNVSFSFSISDSNPFKPGYFVKVPNTLRNGGPLRLEPATEESTEKLNYPSRLGTKSLDELFSNRESGLGQSISLLYQKLDEGNMGGHIMGMGFSNNALESVKTQPRSSSRSPGGSSRYGNDDVDYTVIEQGVEVSTKDPMGIQHQGNKRSDSEILDGLEIFKEDKGCTGEKIEWFSELDTFDIVKNGRSTEDILFRDDTTSLKEPMVIELDSDFSDDSFISKPLEFDLSLDIENAQRKNFTESSSSYHPSKLKRLLSLVDNAESIEDDFLKMLSVSHNPPDTVSDGDLDFPGYYPGKQFAEDTQPFLDTDSIIAQPIDSCCLAPSGFAQLEFDYDSDLELGIQEVEKHNLNLNQTSLTMSNAKMLENMETELLMHEWGLNEDAFQNPQHSCSGGFGSPVYIPAEEPLKLPSLGENLGPIIQTRSNGFLRSMNPLLFRNSHNGARLIVQLSAPFVLPLSMGSNAIEVLQRWASFGVEKMSAQVKELMPLEDITEKTIQDMVSAVKSKLVASQSSDPQHERETEQVRWAGKNTSKDLQFSTHGSYPRSRCSDLEDVECEYISLGNLVPVAIKDIEALLVEGLKIQSGFQEQEAPSRAKVQFYCNSGNGYDPFHSMDVYEAVEYAIPLEEWIRLTCGDFDPRVEGDDHILKLFAAHHSRSVGLSGKYPAREHEEEVVELGNSGIADSHFTIALKVQLRDPLRNYEMVGPFMLALVEVEKRHCSILPKKIEEEEEEEEDGMYEKLLAFKVLKVNLAGLTGNDHHLWGTIRQQQSGSRWLLSSGLGLKNTKQHPPTSAIMINRVNNIRKGNFLWSISSQTHGEAAVWNDLVELNIHVRNPDIIVPNEVSSF